MKSKLKYIYILLRNIIILCVLLEIGLGVFYHYKDKSGIDNNTERIIASGLYENDDIDDKAIKIIFRELRQQDMMWEPYLHYRFKPMAGKYNTIYDNGLRKTYNPSLKDSATALKVFCFGGSTMYSSGSRDEFTISSELSKLISNEFPNQNVEVINFGCHGYTRATENIQLQRELIKNNIPDIVVFYDGVNEVISAHQNNEAGSPTNAYNRKKEFKIAHSYKKRIALMVYSSNLYRFITSLQRKLSTGSAYAKLNPRDDSLAKDIADTYIGFVKISKSLENEYGFKAFNFMQPQIFSKKHLTKFEQEYHSSHQYYENLYTLSYNKVRQDTLMQTDSTFIDISDVFDQEKQTMYFDFCHTGEYGNQLVAKSIFDTIESELIQKLKTKSIQKEQQQSFQQK